MEDHSELQVSVLYGRIFYGSDIFVLDEAFKEYRLWDCAESPIVPMTVDGRKRHRSSLMHATRLIKSLRFFRGSSEIWSRFLEPSSSVLHTSAMLKKIKQTGALPLPKPRDAKARAGGPKGPAPPSPRRPPSSPRRVAAPVDDVRQLVQPFSFFPSFFFFFRSLSLPKAHGTAI